MTVDAVGLEVGILEAGEVDREVGHEGARVAVEDSTDHSISNRKRTRGTEEWLGRLALCT